MADQEKPNQRAEKHERQQRIKDPQQQRIGFLRLELACAQQFFLKLGRKRGFNFEGDFGLGAGAVDGLVFPGDFTNVLILRIVIDNSLDHEVRLHQLNEIRITENAVFCLRLAVEPPDERH